MPFFDKPSRGSYSLFLMVVVIFFGLLFVSFSIFIFDSTRSEMDKNVLPIFISGIFFVIGIGLALFSPIYYWRFRERTAQINWLVKNGRKVTGFVTNLINYDQSFKFEVTAPDMQGKPHIFVSDMLVAVSNSGLSLADFYKKKIPADVYINPENPNEYYVDIESIPELTGKNFIYYGKSLYEGIIKKKIRNVESKDL